MRAGRSNSERAVGLLEQALGGRQLVWFGIRGEDASTLARFDQLTHSLTVTSALDWPTSEGSISLEQLSGRRPDLDAYDIDEDPRSEVEEFRLRLVDAVRKPSVLVTYRPAWITTALAFAKPTVALAGPVVTRQRAFEYKPWVERSLRSEGVRGLGWRYLLPDQHQEACEAVAGGAQVLRCDRGAGGVGVAYVDSCSAVERFWRTRRGPLTAIAPFREGIPVNFSGCVFADGSVRLHPPSVQLIGIEGCTNRRFGYCGNDFGAIAEVDAEQLRGLDALGSAVGGWLHGERYLGAFGVDALLAEDAVFFVELNPRFQGSSGLSASIAVAMGESDLFVDHIAATLGMPPPTQGLPVSRWAREQPTRSQVVVHNNLDTAVVIDPAGAPLRTRSGDAITFAPGAAVEPGGTLSRLTLDETITETGFDLSAPARDLVTEVREGFVVEGPIEDRQSHAKP